MHDTNKKQFVIWKYAHQNRMNKLSFQLEYNGTVYVKNKYINSIALSFQTNGFQTDSNFMLGYSLRSFIR